MSVNKKKKFIRREQKVNLLNSVNEKSLDVLRQFGHIYRGPGSGKLYIRPYRKLNQ